MPTDCKMKQLKEIATAFDAISQKLFDMMSNMKDGDTVNRYSKLLALTKCAEVNTVQLRNITARENLNTSIDPMTSSAQALSIKIEKENGWVKIAVPAILPGRNRKDAVSFLTHPLRNSLILFQRQANVARFSDCIVCIVHQYDEALGTKRVRDYDNIETKRYLDVIEAFLLTTDGGLQCSVFQTTKISDRDRTEFYIMPRNSFAEWQKKYL